MLNNLTAPIIPLSQGSTRRKHGPASEPSADRSLHRESGGRATEDQGGA